MGCKVIGIISYLPDDIQKRELRFKKLCELINTCNQLFNLPIYILIQNYSEEFTKILQKCNNCVVSVNYPRLGIVGARKALRSWFLDSSYDCLIMLDDDCQIKGSLDGAKEYLEEVDAHPSGFGEFRGSQLKLFAITKDILSQVDYDNVNPELGEGFEDTLFVERLRKNFQAKRYIFSKRNLKEISSGAKDALSTWYVDQDLHKMLGNTSKLMGDK